MRHVPAEPTYEFGPYHFDAGHRRLMRGAEVVPLPERQADALRVLVSRAGQIVPKHVLIEAAWPAISVSDNSVEQLMSALRRTLGPAPDGAAYVETLPRRGYRFRSVVTPRAARQTDDALAALLQPYQTFLEGRAALETLERDAVARACAAFADVVRSSPDYAPGHLGLANAHALLFDATRGEERPDVASAAAALHHAREACRLAPQSGEAWATLAFVLSRTRHPDASPAGRRAITLEPDHWRHHLRLAYATWGESRLRAAGDAVRLMPGLGLGHWLAATVFVARNALNEAARELAAGILAQDQQHDRGRFRSVGLHLLHGLVLLAIGDVQGADDALVRELAAEPTGHLYASQAAAHTWSAIGALRLQQDRRPEAVAAFERALDRLPGHPPALAALSVVGEDETRSTARRRLEQRVASLQLAGAHIEAATALAAADVLAGRGEEAAARLAAVLESAPAAGSAGWTIPVDPLLRVSANPARWRRVLAILGQRAA